MHVKVTIEMVLDLPYADIDPEDLCIGSVDSISFVSIKDEHNELADQSNIESYSTVGCVVLPPDE